MKSLCLTGSDERSYLPPGFPSVTRWVAFKWHQPGDSKWPFYPPNWRSLNPLKGHLTIPKRSLWITRKCCFSCFPRIFFLWGRGGVANRHVPEKSLQPLDIHCHRNWGSVWLEPKNIYTQQKFRRCETGSMFRENKKQQYSRHNNSQFVRTSCKEKSRHFGDQYWLVVSIIFFHSYFGKFCNLTNIFQMGWNHQPEYISAGGTVATSERTTSSKTPWYVSRNPRWKLQWRSSWWSRKAIRPRSDLGRWGVFKDPGAGSFVLEWRSPYETTPIKMAGL